MAESEMVEFVVKMPKEKYDIICNMYETFPAQIYLEYDDGEDGGWGFYNEDGDFIADLDGIDAWMQIPQHERDKNYIPKRRTEDLTIDVPGSEEEEEKDR